MHVLGLARVVMDDCGVVKQCPDPAVGASGIKNGLEVASASSLRCPCATRLDLHGRPDSQFQCNQDESSSPQPPSLFQGFSQPAQPLMIPPQGFRSSGSTTHAPTTIHIGRLGQEACRDS